MKNMNPTPSMNARKRSTLITIWVAVGVLAVAVLTCAGAAQQGRGKSQSKGAGMHISLTSPVFQANREIPKDYTCEGQDLSPELHWTKAPPGTQSFALIVDDPDAPSGTFTHWVLFDLPPDKTDLPKGVPSNEHLGAGGTQGINSFGKIGYGGPCPPSGSAHRYFFKLYALDKTLGLKPGAKKQDVERAMEGHVLEKTELMGKYQRKGKAAA